MKTKFRKSVSCEVFLWTRVQGLLQRETFLYGKCKHYVYLSDPILYFDLKQLYHISITKITNIYYCTSATGIYSYSYFNKKIQNTQVIMDHIKIGDHSHLLMAKVHFLHVPHLCPPPPGTHYRGLPFSLSHIKLPPTATESSKLHLKFKPWCNISMTRFSSLKK